MNLRPLPWRLAIEHQDGEIAGIVRNDDLPTLFAYRSEEWRFERLVKVVEASRTLAATRLGEQVADAIVEAMVSISDYKGDFFVVWRKHNAAFEACVTDALAMENETEIEHQVDSPAI